MQTVLSKPQVYKLSRSSRVVLMYDKILFMNLNDSIAERIVQDLANSKMNEEELLQEEGVISIDNIDSLTSVEDSAKVTVYYVLSEGTFPVKTKMNFYSKSIKNEFIKSIQTIGGQDFSTFNQKNTLWSSIVGPLQRIVATAIIGGGFSLLAYLMENSDRYSFRIPIVLYPIILFMEYTGFIPVVCFVALMLLFLLIELMRNMIKPTMRLTLVRTINSYSNKGLGA